MVTKQRFKLVFITKLDKLLRRDFNGMWILMHGLTVS